MVVAGAITVGSQPVRAKLLGRIRQQPRNGEGTGPRNVKVLEQVACGALGGTMCTMVGHPFDLMKVRLQTQRIVKGQPPPYKGLIDVVGKTFRRDGFRGFFRGYLPVAMSSSPITASRFAGYEVGKQLATTIWGLEGTSKRETKHIMFAGAIASTPLMIIQAPLDRAKCLLQVQGQKKGTARVQKVDGLMDCIKRVYHTGGIRSVYRGQVVSCLRTCPGTVLYMTTNEKMKEWIIPAGEKPKVWQLAFSGGCAGAALWGVTLPFDTLKSVIQTAPPGTDTRLATVAGKLMRTGGVAALYRGGVTVIIRSFPVNAVCFSTVHYASEFLQHMKS